MTHRDLALEILANLPYTTNEQQMQVAMALARFCLPAPEVTYARSSDRVFVLNGYAGTGKTSLTGALVRALTATPIDTVLLAPTGRAAKVFGNYARRHASTIHRRIYRHALPGSNAAAATPRENTARNTLFIVDEASMIGAGSDNGHNLLNDLVYYVYSGDNCRLLLLGDTAQLPPVGQESSPAMDPAVLRTMGLKVTRATLTEVARQDQLSGILANATALRRSLRGGPSDEVRPVSLDVTGVDDCRRVDGVDLPDLLDSLYRDDGIDDTIVVTRSNRSAVDFNRAIRGMVLGYEEELVPGDMLIAAKNNYFWSRGVKGLDFIANGESLRVERIIGQEVKYGLRFIDVVFSVPGAPEVEFTAKIIPDCLYSAAVALDYPVSEALFQAIYNDPELHAPEASHGERVKAMQSSPYWNALQMKYAYAVTCHKAQGGQWKNVLVDLSYIPPEMVGYEFNRWLYTAVTRATTRLYLINPPDALVK